MLNVAGDHSPGGTILKTAILQHISYRVLQLRGSGKLVSLPSIRCIKRRVARKLSAAFAVLNGNRIAPVVELHDLDVSVMIRERCLVMSVFNIKHATCFFTGLFGYLNDPTRLICAAEIISVAQLITVYVSSLGQHTVGVVGIYAAFAILILDTDQISTGVTVIFTGDIADFIFTSSQIADFCQIACRIAKAILPTCAICDRGDVIAVVRKIRDCDITLCLLIVFLFI